MAESRTTKDKIFSTLWAVFFGILASFIFILAFGFNPINVYYTMFFKIAFAKNETGNLLLITSIFIFASIAIAIAFKSSLFNIGVPGQMMISGMISLMIVLNLTSINIYLRLALAAFLGILASTIIGFFVGILKSFLRVNEVISTILLNWIVYYIAKFFLSTDTLKIGFTSNSFLTSQSISEPSFLNSIFLTKNFAVIILFLALFFAFLIWFLLQKTTIGLKIKIIGQNKDAAAYAGVNNKIVTISTMTFSGLVAGIAGFIWYIFYRRSFSLLGGMPREGFDAILVSLLAFNSPFGIIPTSFFYSMLSIGANALESYSIGLNQQTMQIVIGIIVYLSAISVVFINFKPLKWTLNSWYLFRSKQFFGAKPKSKSPPQGGLEQNIHFFENKKNEYLKQFLTGKNQIFWLYRQIQLLNFKLYFLNRKLLKIKNKDNLVHWKQIRTEIKTNFGLNSNFKNKNSDEKLAFFEEIAKKKRLANQKLNSFGYFDFKNNFITFKQQVFEQHLQFKTLRAQIIVDFIEKSRLKKQEKKGK
ncbi:ABC transporter permease [Mycoplasma sp. 'Moose RK']|uniref:ABC transporter permease n=1 Tax=Mycoplasma sp. 'Moose RK' TaxID=2780095 RepID=UPI00280B1EE8|nr:ABC transporter permease [Mycoplasma sp. 'Moose RK']